MRLWHYQLLPYLPDLQFKGQLRELVLIMKQRREGTCNHLLINNVMDYLGNDLYAYAELYLVEYVKRYHKTPKSLTEEMKIYEKDFGKGKPTEIFRDWHNFEYLRICMANLYEKHKYAKGKSRITDSEWKRLSDAYKIFVWGEYKV